jgi:hypothetical protein
MPDLKYFYRFLHRYRYWSSADCWDCVKQSLLPREYLGHLIDLEISKYKGESMNAITTYCLIFVNCILSGIISVDS